jgi:hypothetical protein
MAVPHDGPTPAPGQPAELATDAELAQALADHRAEVLATAHPDSDSLVARVGTAETDITAIQVAIDAVETDVTNLQIYLNAADFGVTGDGVVDDTAELQAAIDALAASSTAAGLIIPAGTYKITAPLELPQGLATKVIRGAGWYITTIRQATSNVPVIKANEENLFSLGLYEMALTYSTAQTTANTGAIALCFTSDTAGIGFGWYYWKVRRLHISNAHIGIGIDKTPGGSLPVWNCEFDQIVMTDISQSLVKLDPNSGGQPINLFRHITHIDSGAPSHGGPAIELVSCEARFEGLDIEDWHNRLIYAFGGSPLTVAGLHVERHKLDTASAMFEIANGPMKIDGADLAFAVEGGAAAQLFTIGSGGSLVVAASRIQATLTSGTITGLTNSTGAEYEFLSVKDENGNVGLPTASVGARVYKAAAQSIPNASQTAVIFDTERFDPYGFHDNAVNNTRLTVPAGRGGDYVISFASAWAPHATGRRQVQLRLNGVTPMAIDTDAATSDLTLPNRGTLTTTYTLAAGDYVEAVVYQTSGGALDLSAGANFSPELSMVRVRA